MGEEIESTEHLVVDGSVEDPFEDLNQLTQIQNKYTFWYRSDSEKNKAQPFNYKDSVKKISTFQSVERFWQIYDHLKRPSDFKTAEFHLFKDGISPFWEDPLNKLGGKWMIRLKKGISARYWEDILLAIIGEQFDVGSEICGAVLSVRITEDIISVWNKTADNTEAVNKIREQIRRIVRLPNVIPIEYKRHQDSLEDRSSYRNPNMVWRAPSKANPHEKDNGAGRTGPYNNYRGEGKFHPPNHEQQPYNKTWKSSRWTESNEAPAQGQQGRAPKDKDESGWRKVGASGKAEPFGYNSRPNRSGSHGEASNDGQSLNAPRGPIGDGWTKVKNPFNKSET